MPRVDFYIISESNNRSQESVACVLTEKAFDQSFKILILGQSEQQLIQLNDTLWTFKEDSFIPHQIIQSEDDIDTAELPVALSQNDTAYPKANLLINLCNKIPSNADSFERIAEIVPGRKAERQQSRERYKQYQALGYELHTHNL